MLRCTPVCDPGTWGFRSERIRVLRVILGYIVRWVEKEDEEDSERGKSRCTGIF